jgi:hypothetical protein
MRWQQPETHGREAHVPAREIETSSSASFTHHKKLWLHGKEDPIWTSLTSTDPTRQCLLFWDTQKKKRCTHTSNA